MNYLQLNIHKKYQQQFLLNKYPNNVLISVNQSAKPHHEVFFLSTNHGICIKLITISTF